MPKKRFMNILDKVEKNRKKTEIELQAKLEKKMKYFPKARPPVNLPGLNFAKTSLARKTK